MTQLNCIIGWGQYPIYRVCQRGSHLPIVHALHLPERGIFQLPWQTPSGRKVSEWEKKRKKKKKKEEGIMPSVVATTYAHARTTCVCRHSVSTKMKKDGGGCWKRHSQLYWQFWGDQHIQGVSKKKKKKKFIQTN